MSRIISIQNSFTKGEIDPKLTARTDIDAYSVIKRAQLKRINNENNRH